MREKVYYSAPVQDEIMRYLYLVRGADIEQITRALNGIKLKEPVLENKIKSTYALLNKLEKYGLVTYYVYKLKERSRERRLYFLTKVGMMELNSQFNIYKNTSGSGFFGDYGYFNHSFFSPPKKSLNHHLMTVDVMTDSYLLSKRNKDRIDVANNLYVAEKTIKPDFAIAFKNGNAKDIYYVEIDRSTERGQLLTNKFKKYNSYFEYLNSQNKPLPKAIFFVVPNGKNGKDIYSNEKQIRFGSVANAFYDTCEAFTAEVDLYFIDMNHFLTTFISELNNDSGKNLEKLSNILKGEKSKIMLENVVTFDRLKEDKAKELFFSVEGCRVKPWVLMLNALKELEKQKKQNQNVLSFFDVPKITLVYSNHFPMEPFTTSFLELKGVKTKIEKKKINKSTDS